MVKLPCPSRPRAEATLAHDDWTLTWFGDEYESARARLRAFVAEGLGADSPRPVGGLYHGSEQFISRTAPDTGPIPEVPRAHWQPLRPPLSEVFALSSQPAKPERSVFLVTMECGPTDHLARPCDR